MFEYFPENYGWSLSVMLSMGMGGEIAEIEQVCAPLSAGRDSDVAWLSAWSSMGNRLAAHARTEQAAGHDTTAAELWLRAANYLLIGERQVAIKSADSLAVYRDGLAAFGSGLALQRPAVEFVDIPFEDSAFPALFIPAASTDAPCVIHFDGLDVMKEIIYLLHRRQLDDHRVAMLICDHPGVGEALRLRGLHATFRTEEPASAAIDYLQSRGDVNLARTGIMALSMGGYYAPRAAAREPRLNFCAVWGASFSVRTAVEHCLALGTGSVDLLNQLRLVFGVAPTEDVWDRIDDCTLEPVIGDLTCPILILHGERDRQVPVSEAQLTYDRATASVSRRLVVIPEGEPGCEHCQIDSVGVAAAVLQDWVVDIAATLR
jgi:fermentation-respiration switch protein FrsA (DUF1100 family)